MARSTGSSLVAFAAKARQDLSSSIVQKTFEQVQLKDSREWKLGLRQLAQAPAEDRPMVLAALLAESSRPLTEHQALTVLDLYFDSAETKLLAFEVMAPEIREWSAGLTDRAKAFVDGLLGSSELPEGARELFLKS
jgi:hypothetical protein